MGCIAVGDDAAQELAAREQDRRRGPAHACLMPVRVIRNFWPGGSGWVWPLIDTVMEPGAPMVIAIGPVARICAVSPACMRYAERSVCLTEVAAGPAGVPLCA